MNDATIISVKTPYMPQKQDYWLNVALTIALIALGFVISRYDLAVSALWYNGSFSLRHSAFVRFIQHDAVWLVAILYAYSLYLYLRGRLGGKSFIDGAKMKFLTVSLVWWSIGFVHLVKSVFGRIRPSQIKFFGGEFDFTPAFAVSSQCRMGCSFVSGHTAIMVWLFAFSLVLPPKARAPFCAFAVSCIILTALGRLMGGFHFISDIYFSVLFVSMGIFSTRKYYF